MEEIDADTLYKNDGRHPHQTKSHCKGHLVNHLLGVITKGSPARFNHMAMGAYAMRVSFQCT
jgi:hypothetical protein